jgi:RNA polymerase sigma factor (sigma-70 family)
MGPVLLSCRELIVMENRVTAKRRSKPSYVVAAVLGTALTALATGQSTAASPDLKAISELGRYCSTCWRNANLPPDAWTDCTQEVFSKILERVPQKSWTEILHGEGEERREFLRAIDAVKKRTQRARKYSNSVEHVADRRQQDAWQLAKEREVVEEAAKEVLSPRQQRILQMSFEGWAVQDMAAELRLPAERVSDEKYKAIRKLREHLCKDENA